MEEEIDIGYYNSEESNEIYRKHCSLLLDRAPNDSVREKMKQILYTGKYGDYKLAVQDLIFKGNATIETKRRAAMAYQLLANPETFDTLVQKNVDLFHGTNINALPGILQNGIQNNAELDAKGVKVITGEQLGKSKKFISFTDDLSIAASYAAIPPSSKELNVPDSFAIIIGVSSDDIKELKHRYVDSDEIEVGVLEGVPVDKIRVIGVPKSKIEFVNKLVGNLPIEVVPMETKEMKHYLSLHTLQKYDMQINETFNPHYFRNPADVEEALKFYTEDIKEMASERKVSGIKDMFMRLKEKLQGKGKDVEHDTNSR